MNVIETRSLTKTYGGRRAVDALDMQVPAGEIYGFVGKNGAGKSTAMKMVAGLVRPSAGEIELFGEARDADGPHRRPHRRPRGAAHVLRARGPHGQGDRHRGRPCRSALPRAA